MLSISVIKQAGYSYQCFSKNVFTATQFNTEILDVLYFQRDCWIIEIWNKWKLQIYYPTPIPLGNILFVIKNKRAFPFFGFFICYQPSLIFRIRIIKLSIFQEFTCYQLIFSSSLRFHNQSRRRLSLINHKQIFKAERSVSSRIHNLLTNLFYIFLLCHIKAYTY